MRTPRFGTIAALGLFIGVSAGALVGCNQPQPQDKRTSGAVGVQAEQKQKQEDQRAVESVNRRNENSE